MNEMYFQWDQLKHAIAAKGKNKLLNVDRNHVCKNHRVIKGARTLSVRKLTSKKFFLYFPTVLVKHIQKLTLKK